MSGGWKIGIAVDSGDTPDILEQSVLGGFLLLKTNMMDDVQYMSREKFDALKQELEQLEKADMPATAQRIDDARQMGDLSENAEYHAAREQLAWQQARAQEIRSLLQQAEIISVGTTSGAVELGSTVTVKIEATGKEKAYYIVGAQEADPLSGKISNESPIGMAFMGKSKGDTVKVDTPAGVQIFKILSVT